MSRRNSLLGSLSSSSGGGVITFYLDSYECVAEEGMTFYDWIFSDYYIHSYFFLSVNSPSIEADRNFILTNVGEDPDFMLLSESGLGYIPNIYLMDAIQPIVYTIDIGDF